MKAVVMTEPGTPDVLQIQTLNDPIIETQTQIKVRLQAAGLNPIDTKLRKRGTFYPQLHPTILGCDGTGIVEEIGSAVTNVLPGDAVYFCNGGLGGPTGNYAELRVVESHCVAKKPTNINFETAASIPLAFITAWESLFDRTSIKPNQTILIHGGAGGVGQFAIQLAKIAGARVCTTVSSLEKAQFVKKLGADQVIIYPDTDFIQATLDWTNGIGVDIAFDTVGGPLFSQTLNTVRIYGTIVSILDPAPDTNWKIARTRNLTIGMELMLTPMLQGLIDYQKHQAKILTQATELIEQGKITSYVSATYPLESAKDAHQRLEAGSMTGKLVLLI